MQDYHYDISGYDYLEYCLIAEQKLCVREVQVQLQGSSVICEKFYRRFQPIINQH